VRIVVTGSLAYDYLMTFPGHFRESIVSEKVDTLSVSFLVDSMRKMRGGVAGNIAYTLALLGEQPVVAGTVGQDFAVYRRQLEAVGVDTSAIITIEDDFTSSCFINTDRSNNQILAFYPGAMKDAGQVTFAPLDLGPGDLVLISPTDPEAMERYALECQRLGVPYLFDPGKQTPRLEAGHIRTGLAGAKVLVSNEYEFGMMARKLGISEEELIHSVPLTVVSRGEHGALIYDNGTGGPPLHVPVAPASAVLDPTGAGDAFLGGLVFGLARGLPLEVVGRIAALSATYCVEHHGGQEHAYSRAEFADRYQQAFGEPLPAEAFAELKAAE
jgi:adenosine kinase